MGTNSGLIARVLACLEREHLAGPGDEVFVAVSGGADSVALLMALFHLKFRVSILHCNFHLRGDESDQDEYFVKLLADQLNLPCKVRHFDTLTTARTRGISIEMAAREERYGWFRELLNTHPGAKIAIAHNADDAIETVLLNLSKGTGIRGLKGIPYSREQGRIIRPMLDVSRRDVIAYLQSEHLSQPWREDSSNMDTVYQRNYIRHHLLPALEHLNPGFRSSMAQTMKQLREVELFYREAIEHHRLLIETSEGDLRISQLLASPAPATLLYELLHRYGFSSQQCQNVANTLATLPSGSVFLSQTHRLIRSWDLLQLLPREPLTFGPHRILLGNLPCSVTLPSGTLLIERTDAGDVDNPLALCLPISWLSSESSLVLRQPNEGDRMAPFGMKYGRKRVSRIFIDGKISHRQREEAVLLCLDNAPLWLIGHSKSEHTRIARGAHAEYIRFQLKPLSPPPIHSAH